MSIINTRPLAGASGNQVTGYNLTKSLRLRRSATAYLSKTYGTSPTSRTTMTYSAWVKRGALGATMSLFGTGNNYESAYFNSSDQLYVGGPYMSAQQGSLTTTQVFRDPSAWYHIVIVFDTTNATAGDRLKLYVNGTRVTSFSSSTNSNQNNTTTEWLVSSFLSTLGTTGASGTGNPFDGYLSEVNFIDGQALTPSSFGETDTITGVWKPKKYTGTYGTNGFYLKFEDNSAATAAAIGKDSSGNGNNWTPNNIGVAATSPYPPSTITSNDVVSNKPNMFDGSLATGTTATTSTDNFITFTPVTPISYTSSVRVNCYAANGYNITNYYSLNGGSETTFVGGGAGFNGAAWITVASGSGTLTSIKIRITRDFPSQTAVNIYAIEVDGALLNNNIDSMQDIPTLTSATAANYCILNPLTFYNSQGGGSVSNGNLTLNASAGANGDTRTYGTFALPSGKWYFETTIGTVDSTYMCVGLSNTLLPVGAGFTTGTVWIYKADGTKFNGTNPASSGTSYGATYTNGDVIGTAIDIDAGTITFYKNNTSQGVAYSNVTANTFPFLYQWLAGCNQSLNFGQQGFTYTPPTGFKALNTYNLPDSTIVAGNKYMDATTYTGTGSSTAIVNAAGFKPDLVWVKNRNTTYIHNWTDSVRGISKILDSASAAAELNDPTYFVTAFNSNGFTQAGNNAVGSNGNTYVGWQWQAGQGSTSSNTSGTITSTTSVNASAGFSIVSYTGNGTVGATIGHGLGVSPNFILFKNRTNSVDWGAYHVSTGNTGFLSLNSTAASSAATTTFLNSTTPSSSVITLGNGNVVNQSTINYVAYCWAEIAGFSKFGSYTGNGSTDGPFVYTGFKPKFVLIKSSSGAFYWVIEDSTRNSYNAVDLELFPNDSLAETNASRPVDFLSNGFKIRHTGTTQNSSGGTYIYAAYAENPFKNSLAR